MPRVVKSFLALLLLLFLQILPLSTIASVKATTKAGNINKKVYVLIFDPILSTQGYKKLTAYTGWTNPHNLSVQTANWFGQITSGRITYTIAKETEVASFQRKVDGFTYTEQQYLTCLGNTSQCHSPDGVDYPNVITTYNICSYVNSNQIDEVWMYGGPYFGYNESALIGPNGFNYNGPSFNVGGCNRLIPIMGFNYERSINEAVHDFGHRTEATMAKVFGSWEENRTNHNWDIFGLVKEQSPSYDYSGCGSTHYAPTSTGGYQYDNATPVLSVCDDFFNYPNLNINAAKKSITCSVWGCSEIGYYQWWFNHIPSYTGYDGTGRYNDWWKYLMAPQEALSPIKGPPSTILPTSTLVMTTVPVTSTAPTSTPTTTITASGTPTATPSVTQSGKATPTESENVDPHLVGFPSATINVTTTGSQNEIPLVIEEHSAGMVNGSQSTAILVTGAVVTGSSIVALVLFNKEWLMKLFKL